MVQKSDIVSMENRPAVAVARYSNKKKKMKQTKVY